MSTRFAPDYEALRIVVHVSHETRKRYEMIAAETHRSIEELIQTQVEESALQYFRGRKDDPGKESNT